MWCPVPAMGAHAHRAQATWLEVPPDVRASRSRPCRLSATPLPGQLPKGGAPESEEAEYMVPAVGHLYSPAPACSPEPLPGELPQGWGPGKQEQGQTHAR